MATKTSTARHSTAPATKAKAPKKAKARAKVNPLPSRAEHDRAIIEDADYFTVVRFLGRARFERRVVPTLRAARELARVLVNGGWQGAMIYAVRGRHDAHVENVTARLCTSSGLFLESNVNGEPL